MKKDLLSISDLEPEDIESLLDLSTSLKGGLKSGRNAASLTGKSLALIFDKPSLRTRVTFEVAMTQTGGHAIYLAPDDILLGARESVSDGAKNLDRWVDGIAIRTFAHERAVVLAQQAHIPVINALTEREHPCQALASVLTLQEKRGDLKRLNFVFVGDGNNVAHSLMLICPKMEINFTIICPPRYKPNPEIVEETKELANRYGTSFLITNDPKEAVRSADIIYTDVWVSMGQESEAALRKKVFRPYQVNEELLILAPAGCLVSHCLPAHRGEEITDAVLDGPSSVAFDEAENRLHVQKAVLIRLMG